MNFLIFWWTTTRLDNTQAVLPLDSWTHGGSWEWYAGRRQDHSGILSHTSSYASTLGLIPCFGLRKIKPQRGHWGVWVTWAMSVIWPGLLVLMSQASCWRRTGDSLQPERNWDCSQWPLKNWILLTTTCVSVKTDPSQGELWDDSLSSRRCFHCSL